MRKNNGEYQHKGFVIVEAGRDEVLIVRFSDVRTELKSYYKILDRDKNEIGTDRKIWTIAQAQRFIDQMLKSGEIVTVQTDSVQST